MRFEKEQIEESMRLLVRFVVRYRKRWAAAGLMLVLGVGSAAGAYFYVPKDYQAALASEEVLNASPDTEWETETTARIVEESTAAAEEWKPTPGELNLAHYFPEGADQSDVTKSLAGEAFKILMTHDEDWISGIYDFSDVTPAQMASRLGRSGSSVKGRYNPKDTRHDRNNPDTWTVNSFKNIRMTAQDGDGNPITPYSNVLEIMSMANLYTYFKGVEDYDLFLSYSKDLWEKSHSYSVSMSEVYYCSGCMSEDAERKEMEELEAAARAEALGLATEESMENPETAEVGTDGLSSGNSESSTDSTDSSAATSAVITGKSAAQKASEAAEAASAEAAEASLMAAAHETIPESTSGVIVSSRNAKETVSATETLAPAPENTEAAGDSTANMDSADIGSAEATPSDASLSDTSVAAAVTSSAAGSSVESTGAALTDCPGHVDLIINMKIIGLDEQQNLFEKDTIGADPAGFDENGWQGWNQYTRASARLLSSQDWFEKYGLTVSSISARNPLTESEIEAYMTELPADLSETRRDIIRYALNSVGKVPYYWGGKPSAPNYAANSFGVLITPDYKGRVYKGLDCSGWINWVYWSVTGRRLPYESTSGLAAIGTRIQRNELQPGDIIVRTGADAHVIMFLGWTSDGRIRCIHESSASVNNVTVGVRDANWPYYRKLVD